MKGKLSRIKDWEKLAEQAEFCPTNLAALCSISLRHLERFFLSQRKKTPTEWLREVKCGNAAKLISQGYSNKAVVAELRFSNQSHFCHEFKRIYGVSPQTFAPGVGCYPADVALRQQCRL
jgi:AraC-like DNA-binding protein